ncbi:hypothetical protein VTJ49DRAFT_4322 [Mycothermus thermophilus]|uniref:DUF676 domain-containing protein n=1 Tax=Humicola insolens TaxID=85995 RepID=A0ABR3V5L5_HUMIN
MDRRDNNDIKVFDKATAVTRDDSRTQDEKSAVADDIHVKDFSEDPSPPPDNGARIEFEETRPRRGLSQASSMASLTAADWEPGFAHIDGEVGRSRYNDTQVDVVAVPCPGADPIQTWTIGLGPSESNSNAGEANGSQSSLRIPSPWITKDLRMAAPKARILLYRHGVLEDDTTLDSLSEDLLEQVFRIRQGTESRPLFFIGHSIGGLVVKNALVRANHCPTYGGIVDNCHGASFFGTPHRGSSYMSMPNLKGSIQNLMGLQRTLPPSLTHEISVRNTELIELHEKFVDMASEFRLWSFYETRESVLSGATGFYNEVQFNAPLVSVKSALLEVWEEDVYAVDSDHAHIAAFGPSNAGILDSYLDDFSQAIDKAARLSLAHIHTPLHLKSLVKVEVIGFYEDPDAAVMSPRPFSQEDPNAEGGSIIRLYSTKYPFKEFLKRGPDRCLAERLDRSRRRRTGLRDASRDNRRDRSVGDTPPEAGLGVSRSESMPVESPSAMDEGVGGSGGRLPRTRSPAHSEPATRPSSPESAASVSTTASDRGVPLSGKFIGIGRSRTFDIMVKQQAKLLMKEHELTTTAGFSRPNAALRKFMWVHMPFNNPVWVKEIFATLAKDMMVDFSRLFDYDNWVSKQIQNRNSESQPAYMKTMCKYLSSADRLASPRIPTPLFGPVANGMPNCLFLYMPYLHFDTYHSMIRRRRLISRRRRHGRAKPVPKWVADQESLELKVIWEYIGFDPPLNCRRTLDQFGHHSLRDTNSRDDDQMLYKLTKRDPSPKHRNGSTINPSSFSLNAARPPSVHGSALGDGDDDSDTESTFEPETGLKDGNVLMVDQLWLWSIDMNTLVTFFPKRESSPTEGTLFQQADLRSSIYNELNGDLTGRTENTLDLAALIVWHAVTVLLDRSSHPDLEIFRVFDEAIGMLAERMTLNMKRFRVNTLDGNAFEEDEDLSDASDMEGESPGAIKKRHRRELERAERENRENTSALLELRDLEDELSTLHKLFEMQESTIRQMKELYLSRDLREVTRNGQDYLDEALEYLDDYKQQTSELLKRVETTRNDYEKMLEMVQRQAQVDEVRWSRLQAELASSQNLSVMIFTTFTVIFLPLTFFTGLFGMNTIEWQDDKIPSLEDIGWISLPSSAAIIILSLVAAFNYRVQSSVKHVYRGTKNCWRTVKRVYAETLEPARRKERKRRKKEERKRRQKEQNKKAMNNEGFDFWDMVKRQRQARRYQIPEQNVTGVGPVHGSSQGPGFITRR